ncbi:hypothetical protein IKG07_02800 [Candidatus Saccharibacteria bacterium]|nr:hypothetical protein [Candidatus Saccharibacteria bacterium]
MSTRGNLARKAVTATAVDKIINCTGILMYAYGTSGDLVELVPREFDLSKVRFCNRGVFYAVDESMEDQLLQIDRQFANIIVHPNFYGNGRDGESIYKFSLNKEGVIPITDHYGRNGDKVYR